MQEWARDKRFKALVFLLLGLLSVSAAAYTYLAYTQAQYVPGSISSISVTGKGEAFVRPDIATFTFSVVVDEKDAVKAQEKAAQIGNDALAYLKAQGVEEKDIKTENYSLNPKYEYETQACTTGWCPPGKQNLVGYTVDETMSVKVRKIDAAGGLIGGVGGKGATNVSGLSFTVDDTDAAKEKVRTEAIADAKTKAQKLASSLGVHLGRLINYSENGNGVPMPMDAYAGGTLKSASMASTPPQIAPGENKIVSNVTLEYEIR